MTFDLTAWIEKRWHLGTVPPAREKTDINDADSKLKAWLEEQGYYNVRVLPDGVIANIHYIFTDSVIIGANYGGFERRICYPKGFGLAEKMCLGMVSVDDAPLPGYTALK